MFSWFLGDGLNKIRDCRFSCVNIKNNPKNSAENGAEKTKNGTDNDFCGSGFILNTNPFKSLCEQLKKTFKQQIENAKFFTDFRFLVITNLHVVEVG